MKRAEIRWHKFSHPDKKRPVLILTRDSILQDLDEVTIAPITSTVRDIQSEVFLSAPEGMSHDCAINCDHLQTVPKAKIGTLIATLAANKMFDVSQAFSFALNL